MVNYADTEKPAEPMTCLLHGIQTLKLGFTMVKLNINSWVAAMPLTLRILLIEEPVRLSPYTR